MATITITITDLPNFHIQVSTDAEPPRVGRSTTPAEGLAMELLATSAHRQAHLVYDAAQVPLAALALDLLHPEQLGYAVSPEVRDRARRALGRLSATEAELRAAHRSGTLDLVADMRKAAAL